MSLEEFKKLYSGVYKITLEIQESISKKNMEETQNLVTKRGLIFEQLNTLKKNVKFDEKDLVDVNKIREQTKQIEKENLENIESLKQEISQKLNSSKKNKKALSSYKVNNLQKPRIFDENG